MLIGFVVSEILAISYDGLLAVHNGPWQFEIAHALYHVTISRMKFLNSNCSTDRNKQLVGILCGLHASTTFFWT